MIKIVEQQQEAFEAQPLEGVQEAEPVKAEEKKREEKPEARNRSKRSGDYDDLPLKRYYSLIALGGTLLIMTGMLVWLSRRNKGDSTFKKSA